MFFQQTNKKSIKPVGDLKQRNEKLALKYSKTNGLMLK